MAIWLERLAIGVASLVLTIGLIALLSGFFAGRDQAGVSGSAAGPGKQLRDLGHGHLRLGQLRPPYETDPPTSGAHVPVPIAKDETPLTNDQLLQALEVGDVVILYGSPAPPPGLRGLASSLAPFTPELAAAGQAVVLGRWPGITGITAVAWTRLLHVSSARDPLLTQFVRAWLGRGAPGR